MNDCPEKAALIRLSGRHATGGRNYVIVDADMFEELSRYSWKLKPNGNGTHFYAVRNSSINGKNVTLRMHRVVLGYAGSLDVDHINRNTLDNRRINLRSVTRSENVRNTPHRLGSGAHCIWPKQDKQLVKQDKQKPNLICNHCGCQFSAEKRSQLFCSESCRKKAKHRRQKTAGSLPPSMRSIT